MNVVRRFSRDDSVVDDLIQESFVEAYFSLSRFRGDGRLEAWLCKIATQVGYRYWRRQNRIARGLWGWIDRRSTELTERKVSLLEPASALFDLLRALPPRDRLLLTLLHGEGLSTREAADRLEWSESMVRVQSHRARLKLKKVLKDRGVTSLQSWIEHLEDGH